MGFKVLGIKGSTVDYKTSGGSPTIVSEAVPLTNRFTMTPTTTDVPFEGDNTAEIISIFTGLAGEVSFDKMSDTLIQHAYGKVIVSTGLPTGIATRIYGGDDGESTPPYVQLTVRAAAIDDAGVSKDLIYTIPKVQLKPLKPGDLGTRAKEGHSFAWTAIKTSTDLLGVALPTVPTGGAYYMRDLAS